MSYLKKSRLQECIKNMLNILENLVIAGKNYRKSLVILHLSKILSKKVQSCQYLNKDLQQRLYKDLTQKLNVVNEVLATKGFSEYYQRIHLNRPALFQRQSQVLLYLNFQVYCQALYHQYIPVILQAIIHQACHC